MCMHQSSACTYNTFVLYIHVQLGLCESVGVGGNAFPDRSVGAIAPMALVLPTLLITDKQHTIPVTCVKNTSVMWRPLDMTT